MVLPVKQRKNSVANTNQLTVGDIRYANEGQCQILSAGLDDEWGPFLATQGVNYTVDKSTNIQQPLLLYPNGPFVGDIGDTITNFSSSATLEASQP